jgi:hypothetical protein
LLLLNKTMTCQGLKNNKWSPETIQTGRNRKAI